MNNYLTALYFCILPMLSFGQIDFRDINSLIYKGELTLATSLIDKKLNPNKISETTALLHQLKGDIYKIEGNIEFSLKHWQESASIRNQIYKNSNDYHHVWKYANLSNYHYEMINKELATLYADSCSKLIMNLSLEKQKEIKIHLIWNILAQSNKQQSGNHNIEYIYDKSINLYNSSIDFQKEHKLGLHNLAKTYHLLGNAYLDKSFAFKNKIDTTQLQVLIKKSIVHHDKAIEIWKKLYGSHHYELGKTLFVKGLLYHYLADNDMDKKIIASKHFSDALFAFGVNSSFTMINSQLQIPNKVDLLMCLKYYTIELLLLNKFLPKEFDYLVKAEKANILAIRFWNEIHKNFHNDNTNQSLAIYELVPQGEEIAILMRKGSSNYEEVCDKFLKANNKLKYFDIFKNKQYDNLTSEISISQLQKELKTNQLFLDFHYCQENKEIYVLKVSKHQSKLSTLSTNILKSAFKFKNSIIDFDFKLYTENAQLLFDSIFHQVNNNIEEVIICPDVRFHDIPFEALLCSDKNITKKDYRKLDYLINKVKIQYTLTPFVFSNKPKTTSLSVGVFTPSFNQEKFTELPFSLNFGKSMALNHLSKSYAGLNATKKAFFESNHSILHISTHSEIDNNNSSNYIQLSDGPIFQNEIGSLSIVPELIIINSCNSGLGKSIIGDGVDGFIREFHKLGVSSTISNSWEVDDKVSNELFLEFYAKLHNGQGSSTALHNAKKDYIKNTPNSSLAAPFYWAGHQSIGEVGFVLDSKETQLKTYTNSCFYYIASLLGLGMVLFWVGKRRKIW